MDVCVRLFCSGEEQGHQGGQLDHGVQSAPKRRRLQVGGFDGEIEIANESLFREACPTIPYEWRRVSGAELARLFPCVCITCVFVLFMISKFRGFACGGGGIA